MCCIKPLPTQELWDKVPQPTDEEIERWKAAVQEAERGEDS